MKKIQKHIEIVRSDLPGLSSLSLKSCKAMYAVLKQRYAAVGVTTVTSEADLELLVSRSPDLVFMGMKVLHIPTADAQNDDQLIWISDYLEYHGIEHTGSGQKAMEFELNKPLAKRQVLAAGLQTAPFLVIKNGVAPAELATSLKFPLFVKPASLGGGEGIDDYSVVHDRAELRAKIESIQAVYTTDILIEEYLPGREFSVAILRDEGTNELTAMPIELVAQSNDRGDRVLGQKMKALDVEVVLPVTDPSMRTQVVDLAVNVFKAIGARDYGRIDIRLSAVGVPHFLEANLIPSLIGGYGSFPKACALNANMNYETMIHRIVDLGLSRLPVLNAPEGLPLLGALLSPTAI